MLEIKDLHASVHDTPILKGVNFKAKAGETHVIMGPNGAGKSTFAKAFAGHPSINITQGDIIYHDKSVIDLLPEERARQGMFMSFQYPMEIPGVTNFQFLHASYNAIAASRGEAALAKDEFEKLLDEKMAMMGMKPEFKERHVNEGFSGGEKKRNEILQMAIINPQLAVLDETDSGLDIDALRVVAEGVNRLMTSDKTLILVTHYQRLLDYIKPDFVHVLLDGKIVRSGTGALALELEEKGYDWLKNE
ncbi:MAG: Fe-S cluster assembly ATPase SufC [Chlamydiota bacterium]